MPSVTRKDPRNTSSFHMESDTIPAIGIPAEKIGPETWMQHGYISKTKSKRPKTQKQ